MNENRFLFLFWSVLGALVLCSCFTAGVAYVSPESVHSVYPKQIHANNSKISDHTILEINDLNISQPQRAIEKNAIPNLDSQADLILKEAKTYLGVPYRYGGMTRRGIDCSAFVINVYKKFDYELPRVSANQAHQGVLIKKNELKKGDLLFFATKRNRKTISHVGIVEDVVGNEVYFIHASSSQGVTISSLKEHYWASKFKFAKRILKETPDEFISL